MMDSPQTTDDEDPGGEGYWIDALIRQRPRQSVLVQEIDPALCTASKRQQYVSVMGGAEIMRTSGM